MSASSVRAKRAVRAGPAAVRKRSVQRNGANGGAEREGVVKLKPVAM